MKGQTQALTAVMITTVTIGAIATAYVWGTPLLEKQQSQAQLQEVERSVINLKDDILSISNSGEGTTTEVEIDVDSGRVEVNPEENYIDITTNTRRPPYPPGRWTLIEGERLQNLSIGEGSYALKESDLPGVVAVRAASGTGDTVITYRVEFRNMYTETPAGPELELVDLQTIGAETATDTVRVLISNDGERKDSIDVNGENLQRTSTEIEIDLR